MTEGDQFFIIQGMKQVSVCFAHKGIVRLSDMFVVEVNDLTVNPQSGRRAMTKYEALICRKCAGEAGYKEKGEKGKKVKESKEGKKNEIAKV